MHHRPPGSVALDMGLDVDSAEQKQQQQQSRRRRQQQQKKPDFAAAARLSFETFVNDVKQRGLGVGDSQTEVRVAFAASIFLYWSASSTILYTTLAYAVDDFYAAWSDDIRYCIKVAACYIYINATANWLLTTLTDNSYKLTLDRPNLRKTLFEPFPEPLKRKLEEESDDSPDEEESGKGRPAIKDDTGLLDGRKFMLPYEAESDNGLQWRRCLVCQHDAPPRTHHCPVCRACVLKRDHHCYMTGRCVGFYNQRFFIVMVFYLMIGLGWGGGGSAVYLWQHYKVHSRWDLFLPYAIYRWLFGHLEGHLVLMLYHCYLFWWIGPMCAVFFMGQLISVSRGTTTHEDAQQQEIVCRQPVRRRFESVFGHFPLLNFLFPAVIIYKQFDDGIHWWDTIDAGKLKRLRRKQQKQQRQVPDSVKSV
uniref:Palmitoyltransferase n=1 Tax=Macrostomum lignano TaxID=282301 RepID=A0A1I8I7J6_9PLAT